MTFAVTEEITDNFESITDTGGSGTVWELIYDIKNKQADFVVFNFDYTKDASTLFAIKTAFEPIEVFEDDESVYANLVDKFYQETWLSEDESAIYEPNHVDAGECRIVIPVTKISNRLKITITPDNATGTDTLVAFASENTVRGNR